MSRVWSQDGSGRKIRGLILRDTVYFASDFHLGVAAQDDSLTREKKIVRWLDAIQDDAQEIYLLGDVFDYWFEYGSVIPKGYSRLFAKIRELRDAGIGMYYFTGNHDMWMFKYMTDEYDIPIYREPIIKEIQGKQVFLAHGDGLGPGDHGYKFIKKIFNNPICQWLYARVHPNAGLWLMKKFSHKSRLMTKEEELDFDIKREWIAQFAEDHSQQNPVDYYIMGHRHLPIIYPLNNKQSTYYNLGDWLHHYSYGKMKDGVFELCFYESKLNKIYGA